MVLHLFIAEPLVKQGGDTDKSAHFLSIEVFRCSNVRDIAPAVQRCPVNIPAFTGVSNPRKLPYSVIATYVLLPNWRLHDVASHCIELRSPWQVASN